METVTKSKQALELAVWETRFSVLRPKRISIASRRSVGSQRNFKTKSTQKKRTEKNWQVCSLMRFGARAVFRPAGAVQS
jgi:hypothetical protein